MGLVQIVAGSARVRSSLMRGYRNSLPVPIVSLAVFLLVLVAAEAYAQPGQADQLGQACTTPGELRKSNPVLVCGEDRTLRYALPTDIPSAPEGGHRTRPEWFSTLGSIMGGPTTSCPALGRITFTNPVMSPDDVVSIVPQGMMISDHVTPIDHGYLSGRSLNKPRDTRTDADWLPVMAPADGTIIELSTLGSPTSLRVTIAHGCETYSIYMVMNRVAGILAAYHDELMAQQSVRISLAVTAGTIFGEQRDNMLDFSVHDGAKWLPGLLAPFSYSMAEAWKPFTVDPWPYFSPDLGQAYESKMQRRSAPRWGVIDHDVAGRAAGNWFLRGTVGYTGASVADYQANGPRFGMVEGKHSYAWSHLAVARHWVQPSRWVFSVGWWANPAGDPKQFLMEIPTGTPEPSELTQATGAVAYRLVTWSVAGQQGDAPLAIDYQLQPGSASGIVALRVNPDGTLSVEVQPGVTDVREFRGFTAAVRTYWR